MASKMAMKLGNKYKFSEVQTQHWDQFADAAGLGKAPARKRIVALAKTLPTQARALQTSPGFAGVAVVNQIVKLIDQRCALTIKRLETA